MCLRSLADLDWGKGLAHFAEVVGKALWGRFLRYYFSPFIFLSHGVLFCSKWYELMPGTPWPDLEEKIRAGTVLGEWPTARDHWGRHAQMSLPAFHTRWH